MLDLEILSGIYWGISTILMEARVKVQVNQSARILIDSTSTFPLRIWTLEGLHAWTGCGFGGTEGIYERISVYIYIYILHIQMP